MGVINVTPDSFSDGGSLYQGNQVAIDRAIDRASKMVVDGVAFLDVGGESTRPGADVVSVEEELARVIPVVEALHARFPVVVSIDTSNAEVMQTAVAAGAGLINDVRALQNEGALAAAAAAQVPICLMHIQGEPKNMQSAPYYDDVVHDIAEYFRLRIEACAAVGIDRNCLIIDPGFGFGKLLDHNLTLLKRLAELQSFDLPILVGMSRKRMIGAVLDKPIDKRIFGGLALAVHAFERGATIVRTHDIEPTIDALRMAHAVLKA